MPLLNFDQPTRGVMQMSYVVQDIHGAIQDWIDKLHVGPWFLLEHFTGERPVYRGRPSTADVAIAMSFAGHMNIELIQPNDTNPSVYKESIESHGYSSLGRRERGRRCRHQALRGDGAGACFPG